MQLHKTSLFAADRPVDSGPPLIVTKRKTEPTITVIVPNDNNESYLRTRLDSVFNQEYNRLEVILLDNASTDNSRAILNEYARCYGNVQCVYNNENDGNVFLQWKKGIELATGSLVWIAEADDYADISFLSKMVDCLESSFNIGVAYCQSYFVDQDGKILGNHLKNLQKLDRCQWNHDFVMEGAEFVRRFMPFMNCLPHASGIVFRRDLADRIDWDELVSFSVSGDRWMWSLLLSQVNLYFCARPMNYSRFDNTTTQRKRNNNIKILYDDVKILKMIEDTVGLSKLQTENAAQQLNKDIEKHFTRQIRPCQWR